MSDSSRAHRLKLQQLDRSSLSSYQLDRLNQLLATILPTNPFYAHKFRDIRLPLASLDQLAELPVTTKRELSEAADATGCGGHRTFPTEEYARLHRTSGTQGRPLTILDTTDDWNWWVETWQYVLDAAAINSHDRALMAFSFGPFIGFWSAYDALVRRGALVIPAGGMSTASRVELVMQTRPTCVCCTPTYALRMAEVAADRQVKLSDAGVRNIIVAGEPGGSIPAVRQRLEQAWHADVIDHSGATEVGPWGFSTSARDGLHVIESEFIAEFLPYQTSGTGGDTSMSELVLTSLGRYGMPAIRYRTGDLVRPVASEGNSSACNFVTLAGGVVGRVDDMVIVRGVNVFPSSIEAIVREFPEVDEFRVTARKIGTMDDLVVEVEDRLEAPERITDLLQRRLGLRIEVQCVTHGSLPRFEAKSQRFVDKR